MDTKERLKQYARMICNIANAGLSFETAYKDIGDIFGFSPSFMKRAHETAVTDPWGVKPPFDPSGIDLTNDTRGILEDLVAGRSLHGNKAFRSNWLLPYNVYNAGDRTVLAEDGTLVTGSAFLEQVVSKAKAEYWTRGLTDHIVCFCMCEILRSKENLNAFGKCEECGKFYFSTKRQPSRRFCSPKCRQSLNNRKDTVSGKRAAWKREKYGWKERPKVKRQP